MDIQYIEGTKVELKYIKYGTTIAIPEKRGHTYMVTNKYDSDDDIAIVDLSRGTIDYGSPSMEVYIVQGYFTIGKGVLDVDSFICKEE